MIFAYKVLSVTYKLATVQDLHTKLDIYNERFQTAYDLQYLPQNGVYKREIFSYQSQILNCEKNNLCVRTYVHAIVDFVPQFPPNDVITCNNSKSSIPHHMHCQHFFERFSGAVTEVEKKTITSNSIQANIRIKREEIARVSKQGCD